MIFAVYFVAIAIGVISIAFNLLFFDKNLFEAVGLAVVYIFISIFGVSLFLVLRGRHVQFWREGE